MENLNISLEEEKSEINSKIEKYEEKKMKSKNIIFLDLI